MGTDLEKWVGRAANPVVNLLHPGVTLRFLEVYTTFREKKLAGDACREIMPMLYFGRFFNRLQRLHTKENSDHDYFF